MLLQTKPHGPFVILKSIGEGKEPAIFINMGPGNFPFDTTLTSPFEKVADNLFAARGFIQENPEGVPFFPTFNSAEEEPGNGVWSEARLLRIKQVLKNNHITSLMDVGCGDGSQVTIALAEDGVRILGLEPVFARAQKLSVANIPVIVGDLPSYVENGGAKVPNLLVLDALQHIQDDREAVNILRDLLLPGGKLIITVPCYSQLYSDYDLALGNRRRYDPEEFLSLMAQSGFSLEHKEFLFSFLLPGAVLRKFLRGEAIKKSHSLEKILNRFGWLVKVLSKAENRLRPGFGLTLLSVFVPG